MVSDLHSCEALVLRHINYGEADVILSLFTPDYGLQKGFAKSARKSRKRFAAVLDPFTQAIFQWKSGRGNFWLLQDSELLTARVGLRADLQRLALASYGVELVELLLEEGQLHSVIYELLCSFLDYLDRGGDHLSAKLLFELRLIYLLGYMPHLLHCSECLKIFDDEPIRFDAIRGGSLCLQCAGSAGVPIGLGTVGSLARSLNVGHQQFDAFSFGRKTIQEASLILTQVLQQVLPREPKSQQFLC
ncbi:DNA replication and repair protein RecO [Desulfuromusa kysingii]|uniref:DNA repair protein RecO n=1 Tax=Desulfuromusa kysingii TaxID=37625 RepID=A0A1H3WEY8_9BACT|nr:DNA repair protein RecO [Desulfuromusa kysingii]SDZ84902.1 DNA replication and repair protein RecO [Desulfuromusa kysingii]